MNDDHASNTFIMSATSPSMPLTVTSSNWPRKKIVFSAERLFCCYSTMAMTFPLDLSEHELCCDFQHTCSLIIPVLSTESPFKHRLGAAGWNVKVTVIFQGIPANVEKGLPVCHQQFHPHYFMFQENVSP